MTTFALDAWTPKAIADHIAATRRLVASAVPSVTAHKRWRDQMTHAGGRS